MTADRDRAQVYAAERAAFDGTDLELTIGFDAVAGALSDVVHGGWWPGPLVTVRKMRADAHSSVTRCSTDLDIAADVGIAESQATLATGAHELAHALAGLDHGHDATFRCAHIDVVTAMTNVDRPTSRGLVHADQLRRAYEAADLAVGERTWPPPPSGGAIPL